ncbi:unnamed protein product [Amoebophrya sp. A120]|nr:unnamed protein product [Amoebophrya sp. A120]|eukprot:GSA120T00018946001.1
MASSYDPAAAPAGNVVTPTKPQPDAKDDKNGAKEKAEKEDYSMVGFKDLFQFADGVDKACYLFGGFNATLYGVGQPAIAYVFGAVFDVGIMNANDMYDKMMDLLVWFGVIGIVCWITATIFTWLYDVAGSRQTCKFREAYCKAVLNMDASWFDEKDPMTVPSRAMTDVRKIKDALGKNFALAVQNLAQFIAGFIFAFALSWRLALVLSAGIPFMGLAAYYFAMALQEINGGTMKYYVKAGAVADEVFGAVKTVLAFGSEKSELERYGEHLEYARAGKARSGGRVGLQVGSLWGVCFLLYGLAFWYGAILVKDGVKNQETGEAFTGGDVMKVFFCVLMGMFGIGSVAPWIQAVAEAKPALKNLKWMMTVEKPVVLPGTKELEGEGALRIDATDVTFAYPTRKDVSVLKGVSFSVSPGQKVAFVGESGCGKSTMIQLLERFYDVSGGSICYNGINVKDLSFESLGSQIGYVAQEPVLFNYSIRENLCFGLKNRPSDEAIKDALKQAQIWDIVSGLPEGLDTLPGTAGSQFSGGQKQRIAIARALVRKPKLLLLDEATSALDYQSERLVQETIDSLSKNSDLTVVVVAHRLSTVRNCDQIFFLQQGTVAEKGTHEELLALKGGYYRLTETQEALSMAEERIPSKDGELSRQVSRAPEGATVVDMSVADGAGAVTEGSIADGTPAAEATLGRSASKERLMAMDVLKTQEEKEKERLAKIEKEYTVPMKRLLSLNTRYELMYYPLGFFFSLCNGSYQPLCAYILIEAMTDFYIVDKNKMQDELNKSVLLFCIIGFVAPLTYCFANGCYSYAGSYMTMRARRLVFSTYLKQEMAYFDEPEHTPGKLTAALESQCSDLSYIAGEQLGVKVETLSAIVCGLTFAYIASWKLAAVVTACLPPLIIAMIILFVVIMGMGGESESPEVIASGGIMAEVVLNLKTVRAMRAEHDFWKTYSNAVVGVRDKEVKKALPSGFAFGFSNGIIFGVYVVGFWYGAVLMRDEGLAPGDMFKAVMCIIFAGMGAGQAGAAMPSIAKAKAAAHDIFELADRVPLIDQTEEGNGNKPDPPALEKIDFSDVFFSYPSRPTVPILQGLTLSLQNGKSVALAGPSGSGKSTIMALLMRYYDVNKGKISLNNSADLTAVNLLKWRLSIGYVGQEPVLFNLNALENILYGVPVDERPKFSAADVKRVAEQANVNFIGDTPGTNQLTWTELLGPRGNKISGGQKQRIAIARALMRNPQILLLDEATSALDSVSEKEVQETLDKLDTKNRLTVTIAHRLSTIQNCDLICVMCDGILLEQGGHQELIDKNGLYKKLLGSQGRKSQVIA